MRVLNRFRQAEKPLSPGAAAGWAAGSLALGILMGVFSKWMDAMAIHDEIWWQRIFGILDLRNIFSEMPVWLLLGAAAAVFSVSAGQAAGNVFLFFAGMTASYHAYTVWICGFNPRQYMLIWYALTLVSPLAAVFCWCAGGKSRAAGVLQILLYFGMMLFVFQAGWFFVSVGRIADLLFLALLAAAMRQPFGKTVLRLGIAFVLRAAVGLIL